MAISKIMPCLDMKNGRDSERLRFGGMRDAGDPRKCLKSRGLSVSFPERP